MSASRLGLQPHSSHRDRDCPAKMVERKVVAGILLFSGWLLVIAGIIIGTVLNDQLKKGYKERLEFDETDTGETCGTDNYGFFYFNLTNPDAVLNGSKPHYEQVGPYNYTRKSCVFDRQANDTIESYRQYFEDYVPNHDGEHSENDLITNVNPGFLGTMFSLESLNPSDPEGFLLKNLIPLFLGDFVATLQDVPFKTQVKSQAFNKLRTETAAPLIEALFRGSQAVSRAYTVFASLPMSTAFDDFFNNLQVKDGVANVTGYIGTDPIDTVQANRILLGNSEPYGWFVDQSEFSGFLGFLQVAQDPSLAPTFMTAYGIGGQQLNRLLTYAGYLYSTYVDETYGGQAGVDMITSGMFYQQWANATIKPDGFGVPFFEVGTQPNLSILPSNLSLSVATQLWDPSNPLSFASIQGSLVWLSASENDTEAIATLTANFSLSTEQLEMILNWLVGIDQVIEPSVIAGLAAQCSCNFTSFDQLPFLQWGSAGVLGASVALFNPSLPNPPEFAIFSMEVSPITPLLFDLERSEELLNGTNGFLKGLNVLTFLGLYGGSVATPENLIEIQGRWGLSGTEAGLMAQYFEYMADDFVHPYLFNEILSKNAGIFVSRQPLEWLYTGQDLLLTFLQRDPHVGVFYSSSEAKTKQEAIDAEPYYRYAYRGGSQELLEASLQRLFYDGKRTLTNWAEEIPVSGNDGGFDFGPDVTKEETLSVWTSLLVRAIDFIYFEESTVKEIDTWTFKLAEYNYLSESEEGSKNGLYYQKYHGLFNVTPYSPFRTFFSRPHFYGVDSEVKEGVTGLDSDNGYYHDWWIRVEPESGATLEKHVVGQLSFQVTPSDKFYPNVYQGFYPIAWQDDAIIMSDEDSKEYRDTVNPVKRGALAAWILGPLLAVVFIAIGVTVCTRQKKSPLVFSDVEMDLEKENNKKTKKEPESFELEKTKSSESLLNTSSTALLSTSSTALISHQKDDVNDTTEKKKRKNKKKKSTSSKKHGSHHRKKEGKEEDNEVEVAALPPKVTPPPPEEKAEEKKPKKEESSDDESSLSSSSSSTD